MRTLARARDRDALLRRLDMLRPDATRRWGRMTVEQMLSHLGAAFRMATGELPVRPRRTPLRPLVKWLTLYLPLPWPRGIPTSPELDVTRPPRRPAAFTTDLAAVRAHIARSARPEPPGREPGPPHPVFGPMTATDWQRWGYLHVDHHLRQFGV